MWTAPGTDSEEENGDYVVDSYVYYPCGEINVNVGHVTLARVILAHATLVNDGTVSWNVGCVDV